MLPLRLFATTFKDSVVQLPTEVIEYSSIQDISHCNRRHIVNFIPSHETFCISIKHGAGRRTLLYNLLRLRQYVSQAKTFRGSLKVGLRLPPEVEKQLTNFRYEYLATLELLQRRSGISGRQRGIVFEYAMETLAYFKKTNAA